MDYDDYLCVIEECERELEDMRAEITQLRAELAESRASEHGLLGRLETCRKDEAALKAELKQERELADGLAQECKRALKYLENTENELGCLLYGAESMRYALYTHAARRNK